MRRILPILLLCMGVAAAGAQAAGAPRNLMIQVRIDADNRQSREGAELSGSIELGRNARIVLPGGETNPGQAGLRGRIYESRREGGGSSVQQVMVLEGVSAFIHVGQSVAVPMHQVVLSPLGAVVSDTVLIRDLGTGFHATPRLADGRVTLEITAYQDTAGRTPLDANVTRVSTTVSGKLGEWLPLAGSSRQEGDSTAGAIRYSTHSQAGERRIWLRVDAP